MTDTPAAVQSIGTVQSVAAKLTRKAVTDLVDAVKAVPDEKMGWQPAPQARPILPQLIECCLVNWVWTNVLRTGTHDWLPQEEAEAAVAPYREIDTAAKAIRHLQATGEELAQVILHLPDERLPLIVAFPGTPQKGVPIAECCFHAYWNLSYHLGQIGYIQTLYGDVEDSGNTGPFGLLPD